uniref:hypothetical protein n=1 Tax=Cupriavidus taiwanensis TaxID=164546 RepID=UPI0013312F38|nr:hypothetical protein [Cupriavidus taiwanensis]
MAAKNDELTTAKAELNNVIAHRHRIEEELAERTAVLDKRARAHDELAKLVDAFRQAVSSFASAQLTVQMAGDISEFRPTLTVLDGIVGRLQSEIRSAIKAK